MKRAVIVGKFHPLHKGHSYLIDTALKESDKVYVLVCDQEYYTISADIRKSWIETIHPQAIVKIIPDIGKDDDSKAWARHTIEFLGFRPDVAYTSENYGISWAKEMSCKHRSVDKKRITVPVSATKIRSNPQKFWEYMNPIVRAHFTKRIIVLGAESTGTTTLASRLAEHYESPWTVELGRYYSLSLLSSKHTWQDKDFVNIATMQQEYENTMASLSSGILICDTNAFATKLWQERYLSRTSETVEELANNAPADLYILTGDEIPFVQDGLRDGEHIRHSMHKRFEEELSIRNLPYILVRGSVNERIQQAVKAIDNLESKKLTLYKEKTQ